MKKKPKRQKYLTDFITSLLLTTSLVIGAYFFHIFQQPLSILNPFPPIEEPIALPEDEISFALTETIAHIPTSTATPTLTATNTATFTPEPTATPMNTTEAEDDRQPTNTPDPDKIIFREVSSLGNVDEIFYTPTPHPVADYLFEFAMLHEAEAMESPWNTFVSNPVLNCNWFGVGGQVFNYNGNPMVGVYIKLGGTYPGDDEFIELYIETEYEHVQGQGGYEFKISGKPIETSSFWVQVLDEEYNAISAKAHFTITKHCTQNLVRIDFVQVK